MEIIKPKDRDAIIQSLRAGVVPRRGLHHIQVGRSKEINAIVKDIDKIVDGSSFFKIVSGEYGTGKTFFLMLTKAIAHEKKIITVNADLTPTKRLYSTSGQAKHLYCELIKNMATKTKPEGGALSSVLERFIVSITEEAAAKQQTTEANLNQKLDSLKELAGGYDFAEILKLFLNASEQGDESLKSNCLKWFRGEYSTRTDAKNDLKIRNIIDDSNYYDHLKLFAKLSKIAGYSGLVIVLDEAVNLYKIQNKKSRDSNYELILMMLNDILQGTTENFGLLIGGTPEFIYNPHRGLYNYEALQSRLAQNGFVKEGMIDFSGPIMPLTKLTQEELYILLHKIVLVYAGGDEKKFLLNTEQIQSFMNHCFKKIGAMYYSTPRLTIKAFIDLIAVLEQNPETSLDSLIPTVSIVEDKGLDGADEQLAEFQL